MDVNHDQVADGLAAEVTALSDNLPVSRKAYEKPEVIYRAPLEAMAGTCTGVGGKSTVSCTVQQS
jgi:hypothetical protein